MLASTFILLFSIGALLYWARLACLNIMRNTRSPEEAERVAEANRLEFQHIRRELEAGAGTEEYENFRDSLRYDFLALTYLLRYAATMQVGRYTGRERLLIVDFHLMRALFRIVSMFSPSTARFALVEMSDILEYFAIIMNRRMDALSAKMLGI